MSDERKAGTARNVALALVETAAATGTRRLFGVPGGGSSLDLIDAAATLGLDFVLCRHETSATFMAAAQNELDGSLGVAVVTKGPGTANAVNGIAHAALDRCAVLLATDGFPARLRAYATHQVFDQQAMLAPVANAHSTLDGEDPTAELERLLCAAYDARRGPVVAELTGAAARQPARVPDAAVVRRALSAADVGRGAGAVATTAPSGRADAATDASTIAARLLARAARPVFVLGLEACESRVADALRPLLRAFGAPVLVTYKGKGTLPDADPLLVGIFTGGAAEMPTVRAADLIVLVGVDPVELILQPWPYDVPVLELARGPRPVHYMTPAVQLFGDLAEQAGVLARALEQRGPGADDPLALAQAALSAGGAGLGAQGLGGLESGGPGPGAAGMDALHGGRWTPTAIARLRHAMRAALVYRGSGPDLGPDRVVEACADAARRAGRHPRASVDAGAHMFSATAFWPCAAPRDLLISNGLATMGFALPAGIAAALHDPARGAIAFTGDGGLMMCLGELGTAVQHRARLVVVVFNDGALSLIDIKQQSRGLPASGVRWPRADFAAMMRGFGGQGWIAHDDSSLVEALDAAFACDGPALVDVHIDPSGYAAQLAAMRG